MPKGATDHFNRVNGKHSIKRSKTGQPSDYKRTSDTSLPLPDSMPSSISGDSDMTSYKVSVFDSLAPRPTLRYATGARRIPSRASGTVRPTSPKGLLSGDNLISEKVLHSRKRIDDLADDLDAKALRELMDRDTKRRQRDRSREQTKTKRKIAETAERYKQEADAARQSGTPSPSNMERGVLGRELVGLGLDPASTVVTSSRQRTSPSPEPLVSKDSQTPLQVFHRADNLPSEEADPEPESAATQPAAPSIEREGSVSTAPQPSRLSSILRSKKSRSKSTLESDKDKLAIPEDESSWRKGSETSTSRPARLSFSSLLKWNSKRKRNSGPSSFSNTSREEMQAVASAQAQVHAQTYAQAEALARLQGDDIRNGPNDSQRSGSSLSGNYVAGKLSQSVPKRTRSRFREDLDDFPTPPDSRVQSPEAEQPPLPSIADSEQSTGAQPIPIPRHGMPATSGQRSHERLGEGGVMAESHTTPSPDQHLSMSLASIDSEGSWLSGGPGNRRSATMRDSLLRASRQVQPKSSPAQSFDEEVGITEDEYMTSLAPGHHGHGFSSVRRSEEGRPSSDEEDNGLKWGAVGAHPQFVHKLNRGTMHSQQALVNIDSEDEDADEESIIEAAT